MFFLFLLAAEEELVKQVVKRDEFCCLHEAFNSFNKDRMSFGLRLPSELLYNTMKRCALDFHPSRSRSRSRSSSLRTGSLPAPQAKTSSLDGGRASKSSSSPVALNSAHYVV